MTLKRKRSMTEDSPMSVSSNASGLSSHVERNHLPGISPSEPQFNSRPSNYLMRQLETQHQTSRPLLHSRTQKRWRNNRPDDESVYLNTLSMLFNAQRHPGAPKSPVLSTQLQQRLQDHRPQASLNAFLNLPGPPMVAPSADCPDDSQAHCEECGRGMLDTSDAMDLDRSERRLCECCGRPVCDICAVTKETRLCLSCDLLVHDGGQVSTFLEQHLE